MYPFSVQTLLCTTTEMKRKGFQQLGLSVLSHLATLTLTLSSLVEDHEGDNGAQDESKRGAQLLAVVGVD